MPVELARPVDPRVARFELGPLVAASGGEAFEFVTLLSVTIPSTSWTSTVKFAVGFGVRSPTVVRQSFARVTSTRW